MPEVEAIDHIAIAVEDIEAARPFYERQLGLAPEGDETVPDQGVKVAFYRVGGVRIELLEPTGDDSPVAKFLARRGPGLHHIAYRVRSLDERLDALRADGVPLVDETPRDGAHGMRIAFLHPSASGKVLTELCEPADG